MSVRAATGVLVVLTLTGCAGDQLTVGSFTPAPQAVDLSLLGRWILAAPNAPSCGLEFDGAPGAHSGTVTPDGSCPGSFYKSRRWSMEEGALTIADGAKQPLALLKSAGTHFEGRSTAGTAVTLSR